LFNQKSHQEQESIFETQERSKSRKNQTPHTSSTNVNELQVHYNQTKKLKILEKNHEKNKSIILV